MSVSSSFQTVERGSRELLSLSTAQNRYFINSLSNKMDNSLLAVRGLTINIL